VKGGGGQKKGKLDQDKSKILNEGFLELNKHTELGISADTKLMHATAAEANATKSFICENGDCSNGD